MKSRGGDDRASEEGAPGVISECPECAVIPTPVLRLP